MTVPTLLPPDPAAPPAADFLPRATIALLGGLGVVFLLELALAVEPPTGMLRASVKTLWAMGGLLRPLVVEQGEWHRLLTAPLLHLDLLHLALNGLALHIVGKLFEPLAGPRWLFALFVIGGLGGTLASLAINPPTTTSVGASGAIMSLCAAALVASFGLPADAAARAQLRGYSLRVLILSLIPVATHGTGIDVAAHAGGALAGGLAALPIRAALLAGGRPRRSRLAPPLALACGLALLAAVVAVVPLWPRYAALGNLIPASRMADPAVARALAERLVIEHPADPRGHYYLALGRIDAGDLAGAARALDEALARMPPVRFYVGAPFESATRVMLAAVLVDLGRREDARTVAQPVCGAPPAAQPAPRLRQVLDEQRLCAP